MDIEMETKREYKGIIAIEQLVARHIDRIMEKDINKKTEEYEEGIEGLIDLLSPEHEKKALEFKKEHGVHYNTTQEGKMRYKALFRHIKRLFSEGNIVWKKSSYEIGKEGVSEKDIELNKKDDNESTLDKVDETVTRIREHFEQDLK